MLGEVRCQASSQSLASAGDPDYFPLKGVCFMLAKAEQVQVRIREGQPNQFVQRVGKRRSHQQCCCTAYNGWYCRKHHRADS